MAYTVVETSKIAAVHGGGHIYSLISENAVENGHVGYVGDLASTVQGLETHTFLAPATALLGTAKVVLVANPEWSYDDSSITNQKLDGFINPANVPFRAYDLMAGDVFMISAEGIDGTPVVGKYLIAQNGKTQLKLVEAAAATTQGFYAKIIGTVQRGLSWTAYAPAGSTGTVYGNGRTMYVVEVKRNDVVDA